MAPRLGIFKHNGVTYPKAHTPNLPKNLYPDTALISQKKWQDIMDYFYSAAPKKLKFPKPRKKIKTGNLFFTPSTPKYHAKAPPMVSSIRFDPGNKVIYLSNASNDEFMVFNKKLRLMDHLNLSSTLSDIKFLNNSSQPGNRKFLLTYIGAGSLSPSDALNGSVMRSSYNPQNKKARKGYYVIKHIDRPVESQMADLNGDGKPDYIIDDFGFRKGSLFWLKNEGNKKVSKKRILSNTPGCIKSVVTDFNHDGRPDVVALCTQSQEAIYLFQNQGKGKFKRKTLLQFPPVYGSSSFELDDFNHDGRPDILYTSGDNSDYSKIYKPYHGVYIFLNEGNDKFKKAWFYHINGAYNAKARDFNHDGRLDIAVISFFADYKHRPQEGFVFFKNNGNLSFTPYHPPATSKGRWITMDVADWTGNGYPDILLANFSMGPKGPMSSKFAKKMQKKWKHDPMFLLLKNHANSNKK